MKRAGTLLLALVMVFSLAMPAAAAEKATATTMRLMETEGTASVKNAAGKTLSVKNNMRLYNGYEVSTKAESYAYISLDSSKAVKLDASSAGEVAKSGRQLELKLTSGKLFFSVPVALESDESMEIRTSTMMMGVRGTSGWVDVLDRYTTRIGVLEGMVTIHSQHPITGADRSVTITGGQTATIIRHERAQAMAQELIRQGVIIEANIVEELTEIGQIVEELREDGIPGFAASEVAKDADLRQRINEESPLDADKIAQNAAAKLAADEANAKQDAEEVQDNTTSVGMKNLFGEVRTEVVTKTNTVTVTETVKGEDVPSGLDNPETTGVKTVLEAAGIAAVTNAGSNFDITELEMKDTDTLYIIGGEIEIDEPWTVKGKITILEGVTVTNTSTITVEGTLDIGSGATMTNNGTININSANSLEVGGYLDNFGTIYVGYGAAGKLLVESTGELCNGDGDSPEGSITISDNYTGSSLENYGTVTNYATVENHAKIVNYGSFYNRWAEEIYEGEEAALDEAKYEEEGEKGEGTLLSSVVRNTGTILNYGTLENYAGFQNSGTIHADGSDIDSQNTNETFALTLCEGSILNMTGGTISAEGYASALCYCGGSLNITGGELYYGEGGSGCALYIEYAGEIMFPENTKAKLKSDDLYGLMGGNRYSSDWGVWYSDYNSYYDYTYSPCHTCKHPVISIGYSGQPNWCYPYYSSDSYFYVDLSAGRYHTYA